MPKRQARKRQAPKRLIEAGDGNLAAKRTKPTDDASAEVAEVLVPQLGDPATTPTRTAADQPQPGPSAAPDGLPETGPSRGNAEIELVGHTHQRSASQLAKDSITLVTEQQGRGHNLELEDRFHDQDSAKHLDLEKPGFSPINIGKLACYIKGYNHAEAYTLLRGFQNGFRIQYEGLRQGRVSKNLKSAISNEQELRAKLNKEIALGRIAGPFKHCPIKNLIVSPIGLVPKSDGGWRMITHLSHPAGSSINDGIDQSHCTVQYTSFDKVTKTIWELGPSTLLAKRDLKSAYRLLPISPQDFQLLGLKVGDDFYVDKNLPMGLSQSANLFEKFSTFLHWVVAKKANTTTLDHLLDDFIFMGKKDSSACQDLVDTFEEVCAELGVPIAIEKSVNPTTIMIFLGLEIDTVLMLIRIPEHRLIELREAIRSTLGRKKITLKHLQSLVGRLSFFGKAVRSSRAFLRRFYDAMAPFKKGFHRLRITKEMRFDLQMWLEFLDDFNGVVYIPEDRWFSSDDLQLFSDSAGSKQLGAGCFFNDQWCFFQWPEVWSTFNVHKDLTFLEMVPVLLSMFLWGRGLANKKLTFNIDNEGLVAALNKQTSKSKRLMQLIRPFILLTMQYNIFFRAVHLPSKRNEIADSISRCQWDRFRQLAPSAVEKPEVIPIKFLSLISSLKLDDY